MKKSIALVFLFISTSISTSFGQLTPAGATPTLEELTIIFDKMMVAIKNIKTIKFRMVKNERYDGKVVESEQTCKQNVKPLKIYMHLTKGPNSGSEVLYVKGENGGKAYVSAGKWVPTLSLDPYGSLVNQKQRHTMFQLGFAFTGDLINHAYQTYKSKAAEYSSYGGIIKWSGRDVYKITLNNKGYKIFDYTVKKDENLIRIARRLKLDEYNLLELNPSLDDYFDIKEGQVIKIPSSFTKTVLMYVDTKTFLPVYQKMTDLKGMVGEYEYHDVIINPVMKADEFSKDFSDYGF